MGQPARLRWHRSGTAPGATPTDRSRTDSRTSRTTRRHPGCAVALAIASCRRSSRYGDRCVVNAVGVDQGGRRLLGHHSLLVLVQHLPRQALDQLEGLASLVAHQAHRRFLDDVVQQHQVLVFEGLLVRAHEVVP